MAGVVKTPCHGRGDLGRIMTWTTVVAEVGRYTVRDLGPGARGGFFNAVVATRVVDAWTGVPVPGAWMTTRMPRPRSGVAPGGFAGLVGMPNRSSTWKFESALSEGVHDADVGGGTR